MNRILKADKDIAITNSRKIVDTRNYIIHGYDSLSVDILWSMIINQTLSKILCKWKQDSVVSLFLYLNSVFKHKHKLIHNQAPV